MAKFFAAVCIAAVVCFTHETAEAAEVTVAEGSGAIGCKYWRVRSITKAVGQYWQVSQFKLFTSADGSGAEVKGKGISSTHKGKPAVGSGLPDTSETKAEKAFDGNAKTFWSASSDLKFEWLGVEFEKEQDIRSIQLQLSDWMMGPTMVIIEKSMDGEIWSRVQEVPNMKDWGKKLQLYPLIQMNLIPKSVFSMRSQKDPTFCIGVTPTPHPSGDEDAEPLPIAENAKLQVQKCDDNKNTQYWQLDGGAQTRLKNAADQKFVMHMDKAENGGTLSVKECKDGCADFKNDVYAYGEEAQGGVMRGKDGNNNLVITAANLKEGAAVTLQECAEKNDKGNDNAEIGKCAKLTDKTLSQWELNPMFIMEQGKQTVACAPYSHEHKKATPCDSQVQAQELCAKDNKCSAYNLVDGTASLTAEDSQAGVQKNTVYLCTDLHEVHSGVAGWELGVRAGRLEPFVEESVAREL